MNYVNELQVFWVVYFLLTVLARQFSLANLIQFIGSGQYLSPPKGACMLGTILHDSGTKFHLDECTRCTCANSSVTCTKETCPVLECVSEYQTILPGRCCPQCLLIEESRTSCSYGGKTYGASIL